MPTHPTPRLESARRAAGAAPAQTHAAPLVNRRSGGYAFHLSRVASAQRAALLLVALGGGAWAARLAPSARRDPVALLVVAAGIGTVLLGARRYHRISARARIGGRSERRVEAVLRRLRPYGVANSLLLGAGGDADHVVVGPGLVVVETKTGRGAVHRVGTTLYAGRRAIPGDPISQALRQARAVSRIVGYPCDAVVCVVDATTPPFVARGATVCSLAHLPGVLAALPARVGRAEQAVVYRTLCGREAELATPTPPPDRLPVAPAPAHAPTHAPARTTTRKLTIRR